MAKINLTKGWEGYLFFIVLGIGCIAIGATSFDVNIWAAIFAIVEGLALIAVTASMVLRPK
jgi:hypothetical protein